MRALSRRQGEVQLEELRFDDLCLGLSTRSLSRREKAVTLGFKEFEVLRILLSNPKRIVPKEDLLTRVWGTDSDAEDNNVEAYISFLRKKLAYLGSRVGIGTVRKVGYRLASTAYIHIQSSISVVTERVYECILKTPPPLLSTSCPFSLLSG